MNENTKIEMTLEKAIEIVFTETIQQHLQPTEEEPYGCYSDGEYLEAERLIKEKLEEKAKAEKKAKAANHLFKILLLKHLSAVPPNGEPKSIRVHSSDDYKWSEYLEGLSEEEVRIVAEEIEKAKGVK